MSRNTVKTVGFFNHLAAADAKTCNRHYLAAHVPFVAAMMTRTDIAQSYQTAEAVVQRDLNGTWTQRPDVWRSVSIRVSIAEGAEAMPEVTRAAIEQDHRRFLSNLRSYLCREEILLEDLAGRPATTKFIIEVGSTSGNFAAVKEKAQSLGNVISAALGSDSGIALAIGNQVRRQERARTVDEPGQGFTPGDFLEEPDVAALFELYATSRQRGEEFIASLDPQLSELEANPEVGTIRCLRLREECQLEKRRDADS